MNDVLDVLVATALSVLGRADTEWEGFEGPLRIGLHQIGGYATAIPSARLASLVRRFARTYSDLVAAIYLAQFEGGESISVLAATHDSVSLRYFFPHREFGASATSVAHSLIRVTVSENTGSSGEARTVPYSEFSHDEQFAWTMLAPASSSAFINGLMPSQRRGFNWLYRGDGFDVIPGIATTVTSMSWAELKQNDPDLRVFTSFARDQYRLEVPPAQQVETVRIAIYEAPDDVPNPWTYFYSRPQDAPLRLLFSTSLPVK